MSIAVQHSVSCVLLFIVYLTISTRNYDDDDNVDGDDDDDERLSPELWNDNNNNNNKNYCFKSLLFGNISRTLVPQQSL